MTWQVMKISDGTFHERNVCRNVQQFITEHLTNYSKKMHFFGVVYHDRGFYFQKIGYTVYHDRGFYFQIKLMGI